MIGSSAASVVLEEAVAEAVGVSSKKWALPLVAFVAGAVVALWATSRGAKSARPAASPDPGKREQPPLR